MTSFILLETFSHGPMRNLDLHSQCSFYKKQSMKSSRRTKMMPQNLRRIPHKNHHVNEKNYQTMRVWVMEAFWELKCRYLTQRRMSPEAALLLPTSKPWISTSCVTIWALQSLNTGSYDTSVGQRQVATGWWAGRPVPLTKQCLLGSYSQCYSASQKWCQQNPEASLGPCWAFPWQGCLDKCL